MSSTAHAAGSAAATACSVWPDEPPTASAAARARMGRRRLPPASRLYRIAASRPGGQSGAAGRKRVNAASICARRVSRYSESDATGMLLVVFRKRGAGRSQIAALVENLDTLLGFFQPCVAETRQLHATLVELERLLEREVAFL